MMNRKLQVAVVGSTGTIGQVLITILNQREFPIANLYPVASKRSLNENIFFAKKQLEVQDIEGFNFSNIDLAFFCAGGEIAKIYAPVAAMQGCIVIDNSSFFRYDEDVPLIIPEVNPQALSQYTKRNIISNPNCSTIQMLVALNPLHVAAGIRRINVSTYQSVSGSGSHAVSELITQTGELLNGRPAIANIYPHQIAFNALPHIDSFQENGYSKEEMKMVWETKKILEDEDILINPTTVRIPTLYGHGEAVHVELKKSIPLSKVRSLLRNAPSIKLLDNLEKNLYPTPILAVGKDDVFVGRIRQDITHPCGINVWIVADNTRKGGALNAVQIAELLYKVYLNK